MTLTIEPEEHVALPLVNVPGRPTRLAGFQVSTTGRFWVSTEEGGIRVPLIVSWPGQIPAGSVSNEVTANWDLFPTLATMAGIAPSERPAPIDGIDLTPVLLGAGQLSARDHLYWEYHAGGGWQAVRIDAFKAIHRRVRQQPDGPIELYDLARDPAETTDVASLHSDLVERARRIMDSRTPSPIPEWNFSPAPARK